jgi:hypothetical protein
MRALRTQFSASVGRIIVNLDVDVASLGPGPMQSLAALCVAEAAMRSFGRRVCWAYFTSFAALKVPRLACGVAPRALSPHGWSAMPAAHPAARARLRTGRRGSRPAEGTPRSDLTTRPSKAPTRNPGNREPGARHWLSACTVPGNHVTRRSTSCPRSPPRTIRGFGSDGHAT